MNLKVTGLDVIDASTEERDLRLECTRIACGDLAKAISLYYWITESDELDETDDEAVDDGDEY